MLPYLGTLQKIKYVIRDLIKIMKNFFLNNQKTLNTG